MESYGKTFGPAPYDLRAPDLERARNERDARFLVPSAVILRSLRAGRRG